MYRLRRLRAGLPRISDLRPRRSSGEVEALRGTKRKLRRRRQVQERGVLQTPSSKVSGCCFSIRQKAGPDRAIICTHAGSYGCQVRGVREVVLHSFVPQHSIHPISRGNVSAQVRTSMSSSQGVQKRSNATLPCLGDVFRRGYAGEGEYEHVLAA